MILRTQRWDENWAGWAGQGVVAEDSSGASCTQSWVTWGPEASVAYSEGQRGMPGTVPRPCITRCRQQDYGTPKDTRPLKPLPT